MKVRTDSERSRVSRLTPLPPGSLSTGPKDAVLTAALSGPRGPPTPAWRDLCLRQKRDNKAPFPPSIPSCWPGAQPVYAGKVSLFPLCLLLARTCLLEGNKHLLKRLLCPHHYCPPPFLKSFGPPHMAHGILFPQPGIEPAPPALEAWGLNDWTTKSLLSLLLTHSITALSTRYRYYLIHLGMWRLREGGSC